jgi:hypothetical protein
VGGGRKKGLLYQYSQIRTEYSPKQKKYNAISGKDYSTQLSSPTLTLPVRTDKPGQTAQHNLASLCLICFKWPFFLVLDFILKTSSKNRFQLEGEEQCYDVTYFVCVCVCVCV